MIVRSVEWLAGLLEGEGSFMACKSRNRRVPRVSLEMTDEDVVRNAAVVGACGRVTGPYMRGNSTVPTWQWNVHRRDEALALAIRLRPYMGLRRRAQIDVLLGTDDRQKSD